MHVTDADVTFCDGPGMLFTQFNKGLPNSWSKLRVIIIVVKVYEIMAESESFWLCFRMFTYRISKGILPFVFLQSIFFIECLMAVTYFLYVISKSL